MHDAPGRDVAALLKVDRSAVIFRLAKIAVKRQCPRQHIGTEVRFGCVSAASVCGSDCLPAPDHL